MALSPVMVVPADILPSISISLFDALPLKLLPPVMISLPFTPVMISPLMVMALLPASVPPSPPVRCPRFWVNTALRRLC